jgi:quinol monooxygenase YgiN
MLKKAEKEIVCIAQFKAQEGKEEQLLETLHTLIPATWAEKGNIRYELNLAIDDPRSITFIEKFASQEAFDYHCETPYIKEFFATDPPKFVESFVVTLYREVLP